MARKAEDLTQETFQEIEELMGQSEVRTRCGPTGARRNWRN